MQERYHGGPTNSANPAGLTAVGYFLFFGMTMASVAATTLLWPGTPLDRAWSLNPSAHRQLLPFGRTVGFLFVLLAASLAIAGTGWFKRRRWGWMLAVAIISTQVLGDLINLLRGDVFRGISGFALAGALLAYLLRPAVRNSFPRRRE
jgi:hypothetical protein